jgi:hypothetical protein
VFVCSALCCVLFLCLICFLYLHFKIFICGTSCLQSAGYFKTGTSIPLQPTRRVFHSTMIQPSSRVRISSYKVIIIIRLFTPPLGDIQILFPGIGNFQRHCFMAPGEAVDLGGWHNNSLAADSAPGTALDALDVCAGVCCRAECTVVVASGAGKLVAVVWKRQPLLPSRSPRARNHGARRCGPWC